MPIPALALALSDGQKAELEALIRNGNTPQKLALRCRLLLLAHQGVANQSIAEQLNLSRPTILALRAAFAKDGIAAILGIRKRKRRAKVLTPELEQKILDATLKTRPGDGSTHWSVRMLAKHLGISRTIVHRVWQRHDVQPHRVERFKLSKDPRFEEKVRDIVGLYWILPTALWFCAWTRRARFRPWIALRRSCHYGPACPNVKRTITSAMARPLCSPRLTF
jgi:DNA-binding CsgD family transcriptional regulator